MMIRRVWYRGKCRVLYVVFAVALYVPFVLIVEHR